MRAVEVVYAIEEALRLIAGYEPPDRPAVEVRPRAGVGYGVTEAPRGALWHRYEIGADGLIKNARIVPPTSQNQAAIEADLRAFVEARIDLDDAELTRQCEQAIRNYDPCISCATHSWSSPSTGPYSPRAEAKAGDAALNVANTRFTSGSVMPRCRSWAVRAGRFGLATGPKQP